MPPKESDHLLGGTYSPEATRKHLAPSHLSFGDEENRQESTTAATSQTRKRRLALVVAVTAAAVVVTLFSYYRFHFANASSSSGGGTQQQQEARTGPYELSELQVGEKFADFFEFYDGPDSLGSAGFNSYVGYQRAVQLGLFNVTKEEDHHHDDESIIYLSTKPTADGPRESIRLEGKTRFDAGLLVLDVDHMPFGCGQWPAFWLTDEDAWPDNGEIDVVEGVNYQTAVKTALHTSDRCSMYAHVADYAKTGHWDRATGIPDTFTGALDFQTSVPADNCHVMAPHQWANQGCVAVSERNDTLGRGVNENGGAVYALQWDPENRYIRSWVFLKSNGIPENLQNAMDTASSSSSSTSSSSSNSDQSSIVAPDPDTWGLPYGYFAIGETTGCSADHFANMRIVLNTAFCGTVSGNRFFTDCPEQAKKFNVSKGDPVKSCNAWIASNPKEMEDAYWKIRGIYVYERAWEAVVPKNDDSSDSSNNSAGQ